MTELLPCPFCGGEAHVISDYSSECDETRWNLWHGCNGHEGEGIGYGYSLHPWFETPWYKTEAEAIAAWNSRAELRSEPVSMRTFDSMETALSIAEKEVEIEELRRENYELCKENEELAHRRAELESTAHGTLTAEQVREAIYAHSIHADCADADWQAIADELNSRAKRTCEVVKGKCSNCGKDLPEDPYSDYEGNYCPSCGAKVVDE